MAVRVTRAGVALTVGIIVLTGLILGGFFLVKNQGEQARRDEAIKIAEQNLKEQSENGVALNEGDKKDESKQEETSEQEQGASGEGMPATGGTGGQSVTELPQTGAGDALPIVGAGLIVLLSVAYYQSRRALLESL